MSSKNFLTPSSHELARGLCRSEVLPRESLKARNIGVLIVSHSLDQVFRLADRICVLRRGNQIGIRDKDKTDKNEVIAMITGVN